MFRATAESNVLCIKTFWAAAISLARGSAGRRSVELSVTSVPEQAMEPCLPVWSDCWRPRRVACAGNLDMGGHFAGEGWSL